MNPILAQIEANSGNKVSIGDAGLNFQECKKMMSFGGKQISSQK